MAYELMAGALIIRALTTVTLDIITKLLPLLTIKMLQYSKARYVSFI